jgi:hypothetical protein
MRWDAPNGWSNLFGSVAIVLLGLLGLPCACSTAQGSGAEPGLAVTRESETPAESPATLSTPEPDRAVTLSFHQSGVYPIQATTTSVAPGESIQAAIDTAADGDVISVSAGTYVEDIDFRGKAITVVGAGADSVLHGTGNGSVVTFASGEDNDSVLDSLLITGGLADQGGGVLVQNSSPTIVRNVIFNNQARVQGSGVFVQASSAIISNNLIVYNRTGRGDPHSVEVTDAAPQIINNSIVRGDSNGIILHGDSPALVMNNILAFNAGRGICDFSTDGSALIHYNTFFRNRKGALLTKGRNFRTIARAEHLIGLPRLLGNVDGLPGFVGGLPRRKPAASGLTVQDFTLSTSHPGAALHAGNPDVAFDNLDGTRNTAGFTGGPAAPEYSHGL